MVYTAKQITETFTKNSTDAFEETVYAISRERVMDYGLIVVNQKVKME